MDSFGKKIAECRKVKEYYQLELARKINTHYSIIGREERDEVKPTILIPLSIRYLISFAKPLGTHFPSTTAPLSNGAFPVSDTRIVLNLLGF